MEVYTITLGFVPPRILEQSLAKYYETSIQDYLFFGNPNHFFLDQHYPIDYSQSRLKEICESFGITYVDLGRNLGLHKGFNYALSLIKPNDEDIIIGYDPDSYPLTFGWDMALIRAIKANAQVAWASLYHDHSAHEFADRGFDQIHFDSNIELRIAKQPMMNSVCAWDAGWLKSVGGLSEPNEWYGGLEIEMWPKLKGKKWGFLPGFVEDARLRHQHDKLYTKYKWELAHNRSTKLDFESWLKEGHTV